MKNQKQNSSFKQFENVQISSPKTEFIKGGSSDFVGITDILVV